MNRHLTTGLLILGILAGPLLGLRFQRDLSQARGILGLSGELTLEKAPPMIAFTTIAFGGFRGLLANILWARAIKLQDQEQYFELVSLAHWITKLQPDFSTVWCIQAWNMVYGVSKQFSAPADRWSWIQSGLQLLREEALRYNPREPEIYRELAWFYLDKIGKQTDEANAYYKEALATEISHFLGRPPRYDDLLKPATEEASQRAQALFKALRLDPAWMAKVDEKYGPLDWRVPESHAIYWAALGLDRGHQVDTIRLRRLVWQGIDGCFRRGRLIANPIDRKLEFGPNLDMIDNAHRVFEDMKKEEPEQQFAVVRAHKQFLLSAVYYLYTHNRIEQAARWFNLVRTQYPGTIPAEYDLDSFVVSTVSEKVERGKPDQVRALIEGFITRYYVNVALGDDDQANGYSRLAQQTHALFQQRYASTPHLLLPPLSEIANRVVAGFGQPGSGISEAMLRRLQGESSSPNPSPPAR
ncbi:MAG: hypothetical protein FJ404_12300 [Verrucomicrobia bacterium]|nr:hypothetical protein [Verrucomicrobiota bacterium]